MTLSMAVHGNTLLEAETNDPSSAAWLKKLSVEELMNVEVYSASRHLQATQTVPNAIFTLTEEDLRRSRVTTIPDALRLVPGVQVGRVDANKWAVSMRGFNSREANKLLVLVDGRSVYDPLFSGMLWESQDVMLEDVERIEVIRGPGGTLWGANAFNGVINIITKHARDTQGALTSGTVGDEEHFIAAMRYGWQPKEGQNARVYFKSFDRDTGFSTVAVPPADDSRMTRGGFRWDFSADERDAFRVSGDFFKAVTGTRETAVFEQDVIHRGQNLLARWNRQNSETNGLQLQFYYDHVDYDSSSFDQRRSTADLELHHSLRFKERHFFVWGAGFRHMQDHTQSAYAGVVDVLPERRRDQLWNVFVQDTIALRPETLQLVAGLKYEHTDYADAEWLPNLRLSWTPDEKRIFWAAVSQAVRVPSRLESDLTFFGSLRLGERFGSEHVRAFELGHRHLISPHLWFDVAAFYNDYSDLRSTEAGTVRNFMRGETHGAELAVRFEPLTAWRVDVAYTYLMMDLGLEPMSTGAASQFTRIEGLAPRHQVTVRSAVDLPRNVGLDATVRFVDKLTTPGFPAYTECDLSVSWLPRPQLELALTGRNLLDPQHPEQIFASSASGMYTEVERSIYASATWRFQ